MKITIDKLINRLQTFKEAVGGEVCVTFDSDGPRFNAIDPSFMRSKELFQFIGSKFVGKAQNLKRQLQIPINKTDHSKHF